MFINGPHRQTAYTTCTGIKQTRLKKSWAYLQAIRHLTDPLSLRFAIASIQHAQHAVKREKLHIDSSVGALPGCDQRC